MTKTWAGLLTIPLGINRNMIVFEFWFLSYGREYGGCRKYKT